MTKSKEELIAYYESNLIKVKNMWESHGERGQEYIKFAEGELEAAKKDGLDGLKIYWKNEGA